MNRDCVAPNLESTENSLISFRDLGLRYGLVQACSDANWKTPTAIQREAVSSAMQGYDVIGLAGTGAGKIGAFILPLVQQVLRTSKTPFGLILTPTRESALQIAEQIEALVSRPSVVCGIIVNGHDTSQSIALANLDIVIATPSSLVYYLENSEDIVLKTIKFLVVDEADRVLAMYSDEVNKILAVIPAGNRNSLLTAKEPIVDIDELTNFLELYQPGRQTLLFSTNMTSEISNFQRTHMIDPVIVEVFSGCEVVDNLVQFYQLAPQEIKDLFLVYTISKAAGHSVIVFCATCIDAIRITRLLRGLNVAAFALHGQLSRTEQVAALNELKTQNQGVLITTDIVNCGLDIPPFDWVINYDFPDHAKVYIDRVGHAARADRSGIVVSFITESDVEIFRRIELQLGRKWRSFEANQSDVFNLDKRVLEALIMMGSSVLECDCVDCSQCGKQSEPPNLGLPYAVSDSLRCITKM